MPLTKYRLPISSDTAEHHLADLEFTPTKPTKPTSSQPGEGANLPELVNSRPSLAQFPPGRAETDYHLTNPNAAMVQEESPKSHTCKSCNGGSRPMEDENLKWCTGCHSVQYCSTVCQKKHWNSHKVICAAIQDLESSQRRNTDSYDHLSQKQKARVVKLVGRKCLIRCFLNHKVTECLWDTGAMVSLLSDGWIKRNMAEVEIRG